MTIARCYTIRYMQQAASQDSTTTSTGTQAKYNRVKKLPLAALSGCNQPHQPLRWKKLTRFLVGRDDIKINKIVGCR